MGAVKKLTACCVAVLCLYMLFAGQLRREHEIAVEAGRMKNVTVEAKAPAQPRESRKPERGSGETQPAGSTPLPSSEAATDACTSLAAAMAWPSGSVSAAAIAKDVVALPV